MNPRILSALSKWYHTAIVAGLILLGFALSTFFQWTFSVNQTRTDTTLTIYPMADGTLRAMPTEVHEYTLMINSAPYKESPAIDLFEKKEDQ